MSESYIRNIVREIIEEASLHPHYIKRLYDRFLNRSTLTVGYEKEGSRGEYVELGTYSLGEDEKNIIRAKAKYIEDYNFPIKDDTGIKLATITINPRNVNFFGEDEKRESIGKNLLFVDSATKSNGNEIYAIVRGNEIMTIYFAKSYVPQTKEKLRVDFIIKNFNPTKAKAKNNVGSRKKVELDLPIVSINGKEWYLDEPNEELVFTKNIKKKVKLDDLPIDTYEQVLDAVAE